MIESNIGPAMEKDKNYICSTIFKQEIFIFWYSLASKGV